MKRREFITLVAGAAAWPLTARAQLIPVVGFLNAASPKTYQKQLAAFEKGLAEYGYVDGKNISILYRWAEDRNERLPELAAELMHSHVTVIAATSTPAAVAARSIAGDIPIVFETGADPIRAGLVNSLNRPGPNVTGVTQSNVEIAPKRLQILHELIPTAKRLALLLDPSIPTIAQTQSKQVSSAAHVLGIELSVMDASSDSELESAFAKIKQSQIPGAVVGGGPFLVSRTEQLAKLALRHAIPTVYETREYAAAGGLASYGSDIAEAYRLAGIYVARILKGEKPEDLPVQQAAKIQLYINMKSARALGITVSDALQGRADELLE